MEPCPFRCRDHAGLDNQVGANRFPAPGGTSCLERTYVRDTMNHYGILRPSTTGYRK